MPERYDRLKIHYITSKGITRACIEINGCSLIGLLSFTETRIREPDDEAPAGDYRYLSPSELYDSLASAGESCKPESGVPLVCCKDCGQINCWSVYAVINNDKDSITWTLRHNHRNWNYDLNFRFEKKLYDAEINSLGNRVTRIAASSCSDC